MTVTSILGFIEATSSKIGKNENDVIIRMKVQKSNHIRFKNTKAAYFLTMKKKQLNYK